MIRGFRHKGLEAFYRTGTNRGINPQHSSRLTIILTVLDAASAIQDCDGPGMRLHRLKGKRRGQFAVTVKNNWRVVFRWDEKGPFDVDYVDYH